MMQSYRPLIHWEYIECKLNVWKNSMDLAGSDGPWLWCRELHDHQLYPKDADEMSPDSRKYCVCQYVRLESLQDWILDIFRSFQDFQVFADFFRVWWNDIEPCWRGLAQALGGHGSPWLVWQLVKATSLSLLTLEAMESNGMWIWWIWWIWMILKSPWHHHWNFTKTGFVQISMVEQNYPGEILPSRCTFLPSQVSW